MQKHICWKNAYYVLTPASKVSQEMIDRYYELVASLKAIPLILTYEKHDYVTAAISHLPHIIASSLVNLVKNCDYEDGTMKRVAAGGFKDITRIASSSPEMWEQICSANSENIIQVLDEYINSLIGIKFSLAEHNTHCIHDLFSTSRDYRNSISDSGSGPIPNSYSIYCDMVDEAGGIAALATILATNGISIKNIGIVHNREFEEAVLHVEFYEETRKNKSSRAASQISLYYIRKIISGGFDGIYKDQKSASRRDYNSGNFGIIYGISSFGLSQGLSITRKEAISSVRLRPPRISSPSS